MKNLLLPALLFAFTTPFAVAQNPSLVADINATSDIPVIDRGMTAISNGLLYFTGVDNNGEGLWRCDGTSAGTYKVKDISSNPGSVSNIADGNGTIYFAANNAEINKGSELWKSDGTSQGTLLLKDIFPGMISSEPELYGYVNGVFLFGATSPDKGKELWKTNGTAVGTVLVKDINPGSDGSLNPVDEFIPPAILGNKIFIRALNITSGYELWVSDGTASGTHLVKDIGAGGVSSYPENMVVYNNAVFFEAYDPANGYALWKSDGTESGTVLVKDFNANSSSTDYINNMIVSNGKLVISVFQITYGTELWISDGTTNGTQLLKDIRPGTANSSPTSLTDINNKVYFSANDGTHGNEPWVTDGTTSGTMLLADLTTGSNGYEVGNFTKAGNDVVFGAKLLIGGALPSSTWSTDGTTVGTIQVYEDCCNPATASSISYNGKAYFISFDGKLLVSDGTISGTQYFPFSIAQTNSSVPFNAGDFYKMIKFNDHQYILLANDGIHGDDPWITDGTAAGTYLLKDFVQEFSAFYSFSKPVDGKIFFWVRNYAADDGVWVTDGTSAGTIHLSSTISIGPDCVALNGILYFSASENQSTFGKLYRSDGTVEGTYLVSSSNPQKVSNLCLLNNEIYFSGTDFITGLELWKSDGTANGTTLVKDIAPGAADSEPQHLIAFNNKLYFQSLGSTVDGELWASDGTATGTYLVKNINPEGYSLPYEFTIAGNTLFFSATTKLSGSELWKTDGTESGTVMVKDIFPGKKIGITQDYGYLTNVNGTLFFAANDSVHGTEVWKSDGTEAGTVMVKDITPGKASSLLSQFRNVNGDLYFVTTVDPDLLPAINHLWRSNGTECGTQQVDLNPAGDDAFHTLTSDGNTLFFFLSTSLYGQEPWKYISSPITTSEICNGIDDDCNGIVDDNALTATITPSGNITACDGELVILTATPGDDFTYTWYYNGNIINGATNASLSSSAIGGSVQVVISSPFGCSDTSDATIVNRIPLPKAKINPLGDLDICLTGSVILKANNGIGYTYQWLLNNVEIPGATKKQYTATAAGNYKVEVTNTDDCSKTSKKVTVITSCKEMAESLASSAIVAYPNPFNDIIHIDLSKLNWSADPLEIRVTDLSGKILFQKTFSYQDKIEIGTELPDGFYLIEVKGNNYHHAIPIVKSN